MIGGINLGTRELRMGRGWWEVHASDLAFCFIKRNDSLNEQPDG